MLSLITELIKFIREIFTRFVGGTPEKNIRKVVAIYDEMHHILNETPVKRLLILKAHNGGGVIKPSGNLYVSVLYEDYKFPFITVKSNYQSLPVDKEYAKMLVELMSSKKFVMEVDKMPDSVLKGIYKTEGVQSSTAYFLGQDKKAVYFCTFANELELSQWFDLAQQTNCEVAVNKFRQNLI